MLWLWKKQLSIWVLNIWNWCYCVNRWYLSPFKEGNNFSKLSYDFLNFLSNHYRSVSHYMRMAKLNRFFAFIFINVEERKGKKKKRSAFSSVFFLIKYAFEEKLAKEQKTKNDTVRSSPFFYFTIIIIFYLG